MTPKNKKTSAVLVGAALLALSFSTASARQHADQEVWEAFRPLLGVWEGSGVGFGATSEVSHVWEIVLDGNFLRLSTRSTSSGVDGATEIHEDVGYVSRDNDRDLFVFRQFLTEGYVNTYDVSVSGDDRITVEFAHREAESAGGMRARMHLVFLGPDEYEMVLDLANPGEEFVACQTMRMRRVE